MDRPWYIKIPCRTVMGHGECCCEDCLCGQCEYIKMLEEEIERLREVS